jgi:hypothetical protein
MSLKNRLERASHCLGVMELVVVVVVQLVAALNVVVSPGTARPSASRGAPSVHLAVVQVAVTMQGSHSLMIYSCRK